MNPNPLSHHLTPSPSRGHEQDAFDRKLAMLRGLADSSRLRILESLAQGSLHVLEVVDVTGLNQPNTSNHLSYLLRCGLIERERAGRFVYYSLADGVGKLLDGLDRLEKKRNPDVGREGS